MTLGVAEIKGKSGHSPGRTIVGLSLAILLAGIGGLAFLIPNMPIWQGLLLLVASFGVAVVVLAKSRWLGQHSADCPACGGRIVGNARGICSGCFRIYDRKSNSYHELDPNYVGERPEFSQLLPRFPSMPALCCACGKPSDTTKKVSTNTLHDLQSVSLEVNMPICSGCAASSTLTPAVVTFDRQENRLRWWLHVSSYAFFVAFSRANASAANPTKP